MRQIRCLSVVISLDLTACENAQHTAASIGDSRPDSGVTADVLGRAQWHSVVENGRVREIVEVLHLRNAFNGTRHYFFDATEHLQQLDDTLAPAHVPSTDTVIAVGISGLPRVTHIEFLLDGPAYAARVAGSTPLPIAPREIANLYRRAYLLLDSASVRRRSRQKP